MSVISVIYLTGAIYLTYTNRIQFDWKNLFNTDGLAIIGCLFAIGELFLSNRNRISRKINEKLISGKQINYRVDICSYDTNKNVEIEKICSIFEDTLKQYLRKSEIHKKPRNKISKSNWNLHYSTLGIDVDYKKNIDDFNIIIQGNSKYGKLNKTKDDILYLSSLIKFISTSFLEETYIRDNLDDIKIELILKYEGSQFKINNLFNEEIKAVDRYDIRIIKDLRPNTEIIINTQEIKLTSTSKGELIDGFIEMTNILCNIA